MSVKRIQKALYAGIGGGFAAFVPLAAGATKWAIAADIGAAIAAGVFTTVTTYFAPVNKTLDGGGVGNGGVL
jgi:hypothetical protein